jgi:hypothetical protein
MTFNFQTTQRNKAEAIEAAHAALDAQTEKMVGHLHDVPHVKAAIAALVGALPDDDTRDVYVAASGYAMAGDDGLASVCLSLNILRAERAAAEAVADVGVVVNENAAAEIGAVVADVGAQAAAALEGFDPQADK